MKKVRLSIMDFYFRMPISIDIFLATVLFWIDYRFSILPFKYLVASDLINYLSNLIATCVSLAGFILAALTIIVTFKANIKSKGLDEAASAMELILHGDQYATIVRFFKKAIIELILNVAFLYLLWLSMANLNNVIISQLLASATAITLLTLWRSLLVLFKILHSENVKSE